MPAGGTIPPDGRPPRAKGIGKTARRHDLEAPATPGLAGTDLHQGDVQRLEAAQRAAPRAKKQNASGQRQPQRNRNQPQRRSDQFQMDVPDPIEMAAQRKGGKPFTPASGNRVAVDPRPWLPLMQQMAATPNVGGSLTAMMVEQFANLQRRPLATQANLINLDEADDILRS